MKPSGLPAKLQRVISHSFEVAVAIVWLLVGLSYFIAPKYTALHSTVARELGWWQWVWCTMYVVAGPMIVYGVVFRSVRCRAAGLVLLGAGLSIQFVAALSGHIELRTFTFGIYAIVCYIKIAFLRSVYIKGRAYEL